MTEPQAMERSVEVIRRQHKALFTKVSNLHGLSRYMQTLNSFALSQ
jgi:hypothetical protein